MTHYIRLFLLSIPLISITAQAESLQKIIDSGCSGKVFPRWDYVKYYIPLNKNKVIYKNIISPQSGWRIGYTNEMKELKLNTYPDYGQYIGISADQNAFVVGTSNAHFDPSASSMITKCHQGNIAGGIMLNLYDSPEQEITYGGVNATFYHEFPYNNIKPWMDNGNLMIQTYLVEPWYLNAGNNRGGEIDFNIFLRHEQTTINYIINIHHTHGIPKEQIHTIDPNTGAIHVTSIIKNGTKFTEKSTYSESTSIISTNLKHPPYHNFNRFYRVNITYDNLKRLLQELQLHSNPADWSVAMIGVFFEVEEKLDKASLAGAFHAFEAYITDKPY